MARFVIFSGPSCIGKSPLNAALKEFYKEIEYGSIPVIKSKESRSGGPRPDEVDIWNNPDYFRYAGEIMSLNDNPQYIVGECRGLPQAVSLKKAIDSEYDLLLVEIYHTIGAQIRGSNYLRDIDVNSVFLSPLSAQEISNLKLSGVDVNAYLTNLMVHKLVVRTRFQNKSLTEETIADNLSRARDAYSELQYAHNYTHVLVNHDGEGNPNWHRMPDGDFEKEPEGDARRTLDAFAEILRTGDSTYAEHWGPNTI